jgi:hypothetical protein
VLGRVEIYAGYVQPQEQIVKASHPLFTESLSEKSPLRRSVMFIAISVFYMSKLRRSGIFMSPLTGLDELSITAWL